MYKVGDLVRIKPRTGDEDDYKFAYADEMTCLEGVICKIVSISESDYDDCEIPDDGNEYELEFAYESDVDKFDENPLGYNWASSMFEKYTDSKNEKTMKYKVGDIVRIKHREGNSNDYKFSFSDPMAALEGCLCKIEDICENDDLHKKKYPDDNARYKLSFANDEEMKKYKEKGKPTSWNWASSMFEKYSGYIYTSTRNKHNYKLNFKI